MVEQHRSPRGPALRWRARAAQILNATAVGGVALAALVAAAAALRHALGGGLPALPLLP